MVKYKWKWGCEDIVEANESLAYIAGLLDGEGTIGVGMSKAGHCSIHAKIANTNEEVIDYISILLPGSNHTRKGSHNRKPCYTVYWHGQNAIDVIELLLPYLIVKRNIANVTLEFWSRCFAYRPVTRTVSEAELILRKSYKSKMNSINSGGKHDN